MDIQKEREAFKLEVSELDSFDLHEFTLSPFEWNEEDQKFYFKPTQLMWETWQAAKASVPEWISVDDNPPPADVTVLVCWDYHPDIEPEKEYMTSDEDLNEYWPNCEDEPPTHWMPLPEAPKAQEPSND